MGSSSALELDHCVTDVRTGVLSHRALAFCQPSAASAPEIFNRGRPDFEIY